MAWRDWRRVYPRIASEFNYDPRTDEEAAALLAGLLAERAARDSGALPRLSALLRGSSAFVFGAGPSLPRDAELFMATGLRGGACLAADGAARCLLSHGLVPSVVVTDLDGGAEGLLEASARGAVTVVHAHGDNVRLLEECVPLFEGQVVGTTQVDPLPDVHNFGGFTDGDRAVLLAGGLGASRIVLAGMDLGGVVGMYSKPSLTGDTPAWPAKARKLAWAGRILEDFALSSHATLYNATSGGSDVKGFKRTTFAELEGSA
ncbi:MAG: DUF115 domain-containing protein [Nitrososphaerota archaeon]|nr:DUF115 domain-containing protein [Nitrososphaerota archaeon]